MMYLQDAVEAGRNRIEAVQQSFLEQPQQSGYNTLIMLAVVGVALVVAAVAFQLHRRQSGCLVDDPKRLFDELCRAHGLTMTQKSTLLTLVKARKLQNPSQIMLDANLWILDPATDKELCTPKYRSRLIHVQKLLFSADQSSAAA